MLFSQKRPFKRYKCHFTIAEKFAYFQMGETMILNKNSIQLSLLRFCKRDLGFVVWWCCFLKRRLFRLLKCHFTRVLLFCKRDLGFVFVSSKRGFLDYKNVILPESNFFFHFSKGDKLFSDFYWGEGVCTHAKLNPESMCFSLFCQNHTS